jgi:hypothetical protein
MATFRKYAFPNEATFTALPVPQGFAVPLGEIEGAYCVDILWDAEPDIAYKPYEVYPKPIGVHTFLGWDEQYTKDYNAHHGLE